MDEIGGSGSALDDLMDEYSSLGSKSIWIWCIEYIAKFKGDVDNILDVMRMAPRLPDDLGKNTNEVVALRILEYLFDPSKGQKEDNPAVSKPEVEIDPSLSCHDVLQEILEEVSLSDLKPGAAALSRWNIGPFVAHKRDNMPKCALERLRDAISKRDRPKERLIIIDDDGDDEDDVINKEVYTSSLGRRNGSKSRKEEVNKASQSQINSGKDDQCDTETQCLDEDHQEIREMAIDDVHNQEETAAEIVEMQGIALLIDRSCRRLEEKIDTGISHDGLDSTRAIQVLNDGDHHGLGSLKRNLETGNHVEQNADDEPTRQNNLIDEEGLCVICKRDGDLLVCTSSGCSVAVHENCLKHPTQHDHNGNFLCPQCYYTLVTSEYYDVMKQLPDARRKCVWLLEKLRFKGKEIMEKWRDQDSLADAIEMGRS